MYRFYGMPATTEPRYGLISAISYAVLICRDRRRSQLQGTSFWERFHKCVYDAGIRSTNLLEYPALLCQGVSSDLTQAILKGLSIPLSECPDIHLPILPTGEAGDLFTPNQSPLLTAYWVETVAKCCKLHGYTEEDILEIPRDITKSQWVAVSCRVRREEDKEIAKVNSDRAKALEELETIEVEVS